jgi:hypothetical protein
LKVLPYPPQAGDNQIVLPVEDKVATAAGLRLNFGSQISADVTETEFAELRGRSELRVEIPAGAIHFLSR